MAIKLDSLQDQAQLDAALEDFAKTIKANQAKNYEEASARTKAKYEALLESNKGYAQTIKELTEANTELTNNFEQTQAELEKAFKSNDTFALSEVLTEANINPKFHNLVIESAGLSSDMADEDLTAALQSVAEEYPEFMVNPRKPSTSPDMSGDGPKEAFNTKTTYQ